MPTTPEFSSENKLCNATFESINTDTLSDIISKFNEEDNSSRKRVSILKNINFFGLSLFNHRMVAKDQVRLVQRNGIPELAGYSGHYQRRKKIWSLWKPWTWFRIFRDDSSTIGVYKISDIITNGYIGCGDRHLVSVNPGEYAKVRIDGQEMLLEKGAHVIKTNNFFYDGKVSNSTNYIKYGNLYRIQVPSAR
jgi:hypothetical protein